MSFENAYGPVMQVRAKVVESIIIGRFQSQNQPIITPSDEFDHCFILLGRDILRGYFKLFDFVSREVHLVVN